MHGLSKKYICQIMLYAIFYWASHYAIFHVMSWRKYIACHSNVALGFTVELLVHSAYLVSVGHVFDLHISNA